MAHTFAMGGYCLEAGLPVPRMKSCNFFQGNEAIFVGIHRLEDALVGRLFATSSCSSRWQAERLIRSGRKLWKSKLRLFANWQTSEPRNLASLLWNRHRYSEDLVCFYARPRKICGLTPAD